MMKCKYCNAEIVNDARFCPNCGKDLSSLAKCVNCGEFLDDEGSYCPQCGTKQPESEENTDNYAEEYQQDHSTRNFLIAFSVLFALIGGILYFTMHGGDSKSIAESEVEINRENSDSLDKTIDDIHSEAGIKKCLESIFSDAYKMNDERVIEMFFSEDFNNINQEVKEIDLKYHADEPGFWCGDIWDGGQSEGLLKIEVERVYEITQNSSLADIVVIHSVDDREYNRCKRKIKLVFENKGIGDSWYIDDVGDTKNGMKEYIQDHKILETVDDNSELYDEPELNNDDAIENEEVTEDQIEKAKREAAKAVDEAAEATRKSLGL